MTPAFAIVIFAAAFLWVIASRALSKRSITSAIVLALAGWLATVGPHPLLKPDVDRSTARVAIELTLALVLFRDASQVGFRSLRTHWRWPAQLLLIGLPLTVGAGYLAGAALFPGVPAASIALIAAALAPTDADLGAAVLDDDRIPSSIRQTINVESGTNDGLATPFVLLFIQAAGAHGAQPHLIVQLGVAVAVGAAVGGLGAMSLRVAGRRHWALADEEPIGAVCLAVLAYYVSVEADGNGYISVFVAGLVFGNRMAHREAHRVLQLTHQLGVFLTFTVWFLFGAVLIPITLDALSWRLIVYAVLSLTVVRMIPVAIASLGVGEPLRAVALVGWLGPRGLASIVFAILAIDELPVATSDPIARAIALTVGLSVVVHGLSAQFAATRYVRAAEGPNHA